MGSSLEQATGAVGEVQVDVNSAMQVAPKESDVQVINNNTSSLGLTVCVEVADKKKNGGSAKTFKRVSGGDKKEEGEKKMEKKRNHEKEDEMDVYEEGHGAKAGYLMVDLMVQNLRKRG